MKIFGLEIRKAKVAEERGLDYVTPYSDALTFSALSNQYAAMNISAVYRAVELISDSIAMLPIKVRMKDGGDEVSNHNLNYVFKNMVITKYDFVKMLVQSVLLKGNGFAVISRGTDGQVTAVRFVEANDVQIHWNKNRNELYYTCSLVSNKKIEPVNMIHLVKNSYDGIDGISVISYASRTVKLANSTENSANAFFTNGCSLAGVLKVQGTLTDRQRQDIRQSWAQAYTNGGNGIAVLPGSMDYQSIQLSAADSQLLESRLYNVSDIARFFGINPVLLGDLTHSSYSTIEAAQQELLVHTLQPYITMIEEEFSRKLILPSESDLEINLDESYILRTDKQAQATYYSTLVANGILSINEVRKELGYADVPGGDKVMIPYTDVNQNTINNNKEESDDEEDNEG